MQNGIALFSASRINSTNQIGINHLETTNYGINPPGFPSLSWPIYLIALLPLAWWRRRFHHGDVIQRCFYRNQKSCVGSRLGVLGYLFFIGFSYLFQFKTHIGHQAVWQTTKEAERDQGVELMKITPRQYKIILALVLFLFLLFVIQGIRTVFSPFPPLRPGGVQCWRLAFR